MSKRTKKSPEERHALAYARLIRQIIALKDYTDQSPAVCIWIGADSTGTNYSITFNSTNVYSVKLNEKFVRNPVSVLGEAVRRDLRKKMRQMQASLSND